MNEHLARKGHAEKLFAQRDAHLGGLPSHILLDLSRNEAAPREWRKAAVELLIDHGHAQANHPELAAVVMEIRAERAARVEVEAVVESAVEQDISGGSHVDFGGAAASPENGQAKIVYARDAEEEIWATPAPSTTDASTEVTPSITCGVTTQTMMQDEVVPSGGRDIDLSFLNDAELPPAEK